VLPCGAILIDGFDFLDQRVTPAAIRPSRIAEQQGDRWTCAGRAVETAVLPFSNVVSVAKNDELNNSVTMRRKVKRVHERIW
jgi:hypothetical protein